MKNILVGVALAVISFGVRAQAVTGKPIPDVTVQQLQAEINALTTKVNQLDGQFTSTALDGAIYSLQMIQVGFGGYPETWHDAYTGTVTLNDDGTFNLANTDTDYANIGPAGNTNVKKTVSDNSAGGTWTLSGLSLTLAITGGSTITGTCNLGGRICVATVLTDVQGAVNLLVLLRTN